MLKFKVSPSHELSLVESQLRIKSHFRFNNKLWQKNFNEFSKNGLPLSWVRRLLNLPGKNRDQLFFARFLSALSNQKNLDAAILEDDIELAIIKHVDLDSLIYKKKSTAVTLSKFAYFHIASDKLILETPLSVSRIEIKHHLFYDLIFSFLPITNIGKAVDKFSVTQKSYDHIVIILSNLKILEAEKCNLENQNHWEFHDLLFHSRTRLGFHKYLSGATFNKAELLSKYPAFKILPKGRKINLKIPNIADIIKRDHKLTTILELRRTKRELHPSVITKNELSEFLFRTFHVKGKGINKRGKVHYEFLYSTYPTAGGCNELEIYLVVNKCQGLLRGLYYYCRDIHSLIFLKDIDGEHQKAILSAQQSACLSNSPQILFLITARFGRVFWKYESAGYSLILKNVGCLLQTVYLVATSMKLSPCALGGCYTGFLESNINQSFLLESVVGEFIL